MSTYKPIYTQLKAGLEFILKKSGTKYFVERDKPRLQKFIAATVDGGVEIEFTYDEFFFKASTGDIFFEEETENSLKESGLDVKDRQYAMLCDFQKSIIERKKTYIEAITENRRMISGTKSLKKAIAECGRGLDENPDEWPSVSSVKRWFVRLNIALGDGMALLRKKPTKRLSLVKKQILERTEELFLHFYRKKYLSPKKYTVEKLWNDMKEAIEVDPHYKDCILPGKSTLHRWIKKRSEYEKVKGQKGYMVAKQEFPKGFQVFEPNYMGTHLELDHTELDIVVVDEETGEPIGSPWLTVFLCRNSRMVWGFYISMDAPSAKTVLKAFRNMILPKYYLKNAYSDIENDWPCYGIPDMVVTDNGSDLHSLAVQAGLTTFTEVVYLKKGEPQLKGKVERFFKTLNDDLFHSDDGTTKSNYIECGNYDSEKHAYQTINGVIYRVHKWIVDVYHERPHGGLQRSPLNHWADNIAEMPNPRFLKDFTKIDELLWKPYSRKIQKYGIEIENLTYKSPELMEIYKQFGKKTEVTVLLDEDDLNLLRVIIPNTQFSIDVPCSKPNYVKDGLTLKEHKKIYQYTKKKLCEEEKISEQKLIRARKTLDAQAEQAKASTKAARKTAGRKNAVDSTTATGTNPKKISQVSKGKVQKNRNRKKDINQISTMEAKKNAA